MQPKFNINRPKISDDELSKHKNFEQLVKQFKQQSIQKAKHDKSWWKSKKVRYSALITGVTVICTITYFELFNKTKTQKSNEKTTTSINNTKNYSSTTQTKNFIAEPYKKIKINYTAYKINNSKGGEINHPTSSKIKIPKNSFVDKNGKDVVGDVTIEYREFHDMGDVIISGIPMLYDSANIKRNFETAGMFDIKGSQNGQPVFIKSGQSLQVDLASHSDEKKFNQYYLDTVKKTWLYLKNDELAYVAPTIHKEVIGETQATNPLLKKLKNEIDVVIPKKIDSVKIVYTKRAETLPKAIEPNKINKPSGKQTFQLDADKKEYPELAAFDNILFEIGDENKNYSKEMSDITWNDVKISEGPQKGKNYILTLTYRKRIEKLVVYPVLTGNDLVKAQKIYQEKFAQYEGLVEKRKADEAKLMEELKAKQTAYLEDIKAKKAEYEKELKKLELQLQLQQQNQLVSQFNSINNATKARRIFQISNFGVFNSDCPHAQPQGKALTPIFVNGNTTILPDLIYVIEHTNKTVVSLGYENNYRFRYNPKNQYSIVAFLNNKLFICSKETFKVTTSKDSNKFNLNEMENSVNTISDFKKAIEI